MEKQVCSKLLLQVEQASFSFNMFFQVQNEAARLTQPAFTCSKLTMETLEQWCEICSKLTIKHQNDARHVIADWIIV